MSIADLKTRPYDVPGIETLSMQMLAGRRNYNLNGRVVQVDAAASDVQVESADTSSVHATIVLHRVSFDLGVVRVHQVT
jgi:hypothetical protein